MSSLLPESSVNIMKIELYRATRTVVVGVITDLFVDLAELLQVVF